MRNLRQLGNPKLILGIVALLVFASVIMFARREPSARWIPETASWDGPDGSFLKYSVARGRPTYLLVSLIPGLRVSFREQDSTRAGTFGGSTFSINVANKSSVSFQLRRQPLFLVINSQGDVLSGSCPLEYHELTALIGLIEKDAHDRRSQARVLEIFRQFVEPQREQWPGDLLSEIGMD